MRLRRFLSPLVIIISVAAFSLEADKTALAQISLTSTSTQHTENFNTLAPGPTTSSSFINGSESNSTILGLYALIGRGPIDDNTTVTYVPDKYGVGDGNAVTAPTPGIADFGNGTSTDRSFGSVLTNAVTATVGGFIAYGFRLVNNDALQNITQVTVGYTAEQWRRNNTANQVLAVSYAVFDSGMGGLSMPTGYSGVSALSFTSLGGTDAGGANPVYRENKSGTISATVRPGQELWIRWVDVNDTGIDHMMAIDDLSVNATFAPLDPTPAPSGVVTALIGSIVGSGHFGFIRWRRRNRSRKK